ncbi:hypothetical protein [Ramlibacter sp.]|uniref:hypothetical protein n=1 Tax=Ramlibacter sp. TaxID=1917967 RepID=UPI003D13D4E2
MFDFRKLFARRARPKRTRHARATRDAREADSDFNSSAAGRGLEVEYKNVIALQLRKWGIDPACVTVDVRRLGRAPDGFDVFIGMLRMEKWQRQSSVHSLLGLPLLEHSVRKAVRSTWLLEFSHFGGLWMHSSEQLHATGQLGELRELLHQVMPRAAMDSSSIMSSSRPVSLADIGADSGPYRDAGPSVPFPR